MVSATTSWPLSRSSRATGCHDHAPIQAPGTRTNVSFGDRSEVVTIHLCAVDTSSVAQKCRSTSVARTMIGRVTSVAHKCVPGSRPRRQGKESAGAGDVFGVARTRTGKVFLHHR